MSGLREFIIRENKRKNIQIFIETLRDFNVPEEKILEKLCNGYNLTKDKAKKYF